MQNNFPFEVVGSSRRCLIVNVPHEGECFISTKGFVTLCQDPKRPYIITVYPEHADPRTGHYFPQTKWVEVAQYHRF
jgi:hypothetical protein